MLVYPSFFRKLYFIGLITLLAACAPDGNSQRIDKKQAYIDARLGFTISYPQQWALFQTRPDFGEYSADSVSWVIKKENLHNSTLEMAVISVQQNGFISEFNIVREILQDLFPKMTLNDQQSVRLPSSEAIMLTGHSPRQIYRIWTISDTDQIFLIICTSAPETFAENLPLFEEITNSFQRLNNNNR